MAAYTLRIFGLAGCLARIRSRVAKVAKVVNNRRELVEVGRLAKKKVSDFPTPRRMKAKL